MSSNSASQGLNVEILTNLGSSPESGTVENLAPESDIEPATKGFYAPHTSPPRFADQLASQVCDLRRKAFARKSPRHKPKLFWWSPSRAHGLAFGTNAIRKHRDAGELVWNHWVDCRGDPFGCVQNRTFPFTGWYSAACLCPPHDSGAKQRENSKWNARRELFQHPSQRKNRLASAKTECRTSQNRRPTP